MRNFFRTLICLAYLLAATPAPAGFVINSFISEPFTLTYLGSITWSTGSTISGSIDIGAANSTKEIFITSLVRAPAARTLTAASTTVDGVAVTKCTTEFSGATVNTASCAFVATPSSSGSVTVTATYNNTLITGAIAVYQVINRPNIGSNQTDAGTVSGTATSATINTTTINANGIWLGAMFHNNANATTTPTGTTQNADITSVSRKHAHASRIIQSSSSTPTDVWSWTGSAEHNGASWAFQ